MTGSVLDESEDRFTLAVGGATVTQCRLDFAFTLLVDFDGGTVAIRIGEPFRVGEHTIDAENAPESAGPAFAVLHKSVEAIEAHKDGRLEVRLGDGLELRVGPGKHYEAWDLTGPDGLRLVSTPGGDLAVWRPAG